MIESAAARGDDADLWRSALAGDADAFAVLFERHLDTVYRFCVRRLGSVTDADDLTSLTFLEVWRKRARARLVDDSLRPWLLGVANNLVRNHSRAQRRHARLLAQLPPPTNEPDHAEEVAEVTAAADRAAAVRACLSRLPARDQDVLALCDMASMPYTAVAEVLGIPVGTVRSRLSRARARLRELLVGLDIITPDSEARNRTFSNPLTPTPARGDQR